VTQVTAATGKNWLSNAANYSSGTVPVDDDRLVFDSGDVDVLYALDHFRANNIDLEIIVSTDYTGQIGLPAKNELGYFEYRAKYFQHRGGGKFLKFIPGLGPIEQAGNVWIDMQDQAGVFVHVLAGRGPTTGPATIHLAGANAATLTNYLIVASGSVFIEPDDAPTDTTKYATFSDVTIGSPGGGAADPQVTFGGNARLTKIDDITVHSGVVNVYAATNGGGSVHRVHGRHDLPDRRRPGGRAHRPHQGHPAGRHARYEQMHGDARDPGAQGLRRQHRARSQRAGRGHDRPGGLQTRQRRRPRRRRSRPRHQSSPRPQRAVDAMITLQPNDRLKATASAAANVDWVVECSDGLVRRGKIDAIETVELVGVRSALVDVLRLAAVNTSGSAQTLILTLVPRGLESGYQLTPSIDLAAGEALYYEPATGLRVMDAAGKIKFSTA
jgi:hypothetical protein